MITVAGVLMSRMITAGTPPVDPLGPVSQNPDDVRQTACRLVQSKTVCDPPPPPHVSSGSGSSGGGFGFLGFFFWALLIAVVVALVYVAVRSFADRTSTRRGSDGDDVADPDDDALLGTVVIDRSREPAGWREEADQHRAEGRFRDALRCRYRGLVGDLARRGLLDEIPGRTTGEERRQLRASAPNAVPFFREAADLFDAAWYGHADVDAAADDRFRALDGEVLANAPALAHRVPRTYEVGRT